MNVLRGVCCWLALFCLAGLTVSLAGCGKKSPSETAAKTPDTDRDPENKKSPDPASNSGQNTGENGAPVKAKRPSGDDPSNSAKDESGSFLKRKLRGPKLGSGR